MDRDYVLSAARPVLLSAAAQARRICELYRGLFADPGFRSVLRLLRIQPEHGGRPGAGPQGRQTIRAERLAAQPLACAAPCAERRRADRSRRAWLLRQVVLAVWLADLPAQRRVLGSGIAPEGTAGARTPDHRPHAIRAAAVPRLCPLWVLFLGNAAVHRAVFSRRTARHPGSPDPRLRQ